MTGRPFNKVKSKRFGITLKKPVYDELKKLAIIADLPVASLASDVIERFIPAIRLMIIGLEDAKKESDELMLHAMDDALLSARLNVEEAIKLAVNINKKKGSLKHKSSYDDNDKDLNIRENKTIKPDGFINHDRLD